MYEYDKIVQKFKELGITEEVIQVYNTLQGYSIESFRDLDYYYDLSSYDDELYNLLYEK